METAMKKLFRLVYLLRALAHLREGAAGARGGYRRSHEHYPLYGRRRGSLLQRLLTRFLSRRSY
jgi:hypothetical protein